MHSANFRWSVVAMAVLFASLAGCNSSHQPDTANLKKAIDDYYRAHPACVWANPVKLPAQADASNDDQTRGFDALVDAGLLNRKAEEKKRFLIGSKQVTDYDISDNGRAAWIPDQSQPGYGDFCFGRREVTSIESVTTTIGQDGANTATVTYSSRLAGVPDWAKSPEVSTAFPDVQAALLSPQSAVSKIRQTQNGWQMMKE